MILLSPSDALIRRVAEAMRPEDAREIWATRRDPPSPEATARLAQELAALTDYGAVCAADDGAPVAFVGGAEAWPGAWFVWMFATPRWPEVGCAVTRWVIGAMIPAIREAGARRVECRSIEGHDQAHAWLEYLGARREATLPEYGRNGETFHVYVWRKGVLPRVKPEDQAQDEEDRNVRKSAQHLQPAEPAQVEAAADAGHRGGRGRRAGGATSRDARARARLHHPHGRAGRPLAGAGGAEALDGAVDQNAALTAAPPSPDQVRGPFARRPHPDLPPLARGKECDGGGATA